MANVTEQNLKQQQTSLMHFKRELSQTTGKLQELANKGDEHAIKRLKSIRVKLQQIDKILPYIGKYIMVNRQAEIQTVAILKESCTVDLQRLKGNVTNVPRAGGILQEPEPSISPSHKLLETHEEEVECITTAAPMQQPSETTNVSGQTEVIPTETQNEVPLAEPSEPAPPAPQSSPELEEQTSSSPALDDPPYANLEFLQSEVEKIHMQEEVSRREDNVVRESPYATLASVRPGEVANNKSHDEVQYAEIVKVLSPTGLSPSPAPKSPYAELDFTRMQQQQQQPPPPSQQQHSLTPTSPRSRLNYVEVSFNSSKSKATIADETDCKTEAMDTTLVPGERENSALDETVTFVEEQKMQTVSASASAHSASSSKSRAEAMQEAIKLFEPSHSSTPEKSSSSKVAPPPVKKKPKQNVPSTNRSSIPKESFTSPSHTTPATEQTGKQDIDEYSGDPSGGPELLISESTETQSAATGTMSVLERIKVSGIYTLGPSL